MSDKRRPVEPKTPQGIATLHPLDEHELDALGHRSDVEFACLPNADLTHRDLRGSSWANLTMSGALSGSDLSDSFITDARFDKVDAANTQLGRVSVVRTAFRGGRLLGSSFPEALLQDVVFEDVQLDLSGMRFARLQRVVFRNCRMLEIDLSNASLQSVLLEDCDLTGSELAKTTFERCEIRACTLDGVRGINDLTGIAMSLADIVDLAPLFAAAIGVQMLE